MKRGRPLTRRKGLAQGVGLKRSRLPGFRSSTLAPISASRVEENRLRATIVPMLIPNRGDAPYFHCRHLDPKTSLCGIYEDRPSMCRDYPVDGACSEKEAQVA